MATTFDAFGLQRLTTYLIRRRSDQIAGRARQFTAPLASGGCALENRHVRPLRCTPGVRAGSIASISMFTCRQLLLNERIFPP